MSDFVSVLLSAFILGISYGIGPCTLACAPLIVPLIMSTANNQKQGLIHSFVFGVGRVIGYIVLGFFAGLIGKEINFFVSKSTLGIFFLLIGIFIILQMKGKLIVFKIRGKCLIKSRFKITGWFMALVSGFVYGLGPCPPLIALLGLAVASKSAFLGAFMGLIFGIGTLISPVLLLGFFSGWFAKQKEFKSVIPYVSGGFLILMGVLYVLL